METRRHPCFDAKGHSGHAGRLHLPVSPDCNLRCLFCRRGVNPGDAEAPGLTRGILPVDKVVETIKRALIVCEDLQVVGVAGPGDPLATGHAIEALRAVRDAYPRLVTCLSTNGLMLPDRAAELAEAGVGFLTVTVNAVDPEILARLCGGIRIDGVWQGVGPLIERQERGVRLAAKLGAQIKVNTVVVPGINDRHVEDVAKAVAAWGASRLNLIPVIPQCALSHVPEPGCEAMEAARAVAGRHLEIVHRCARCRADACGVPGVSDYSGWLYGGGPAAPGFSHG